jgi:hypothetical protein
VITEYDWLNEPQHEDPCEHPKDSFIGSRRVIDPDDNYAIKWIDIYIFSTKYGPHVCLRISDKHEDYISPGPLFRFLTMTHHNEVYRQCVELITHLGDVIWRPKEARKGYETRYPYTSSG